jgi:hypothetical protein
LLAGGAASQRLTRFVPDPELYRDAAMAELASKASERYGSELEI